MRYHGSLDLAASVHSESVHSGYAPAQGMPNLSAGLTVNTCLGPGAFCLAQTRCHSLCGPRCCHENSGTWTAHPRFGGSQQGCSSSHGRRPDNDSANVSALEGLHTSFGLPLGHDFWRRGVVYAGDAGPIAGAMARARASRSISIAVFGGSVSDRGGCAATCYTFDRSPHSCRPACWGCWHTRVKMWFERAGIAASVVNLAKRATGPEYASSCKLVGRHTHLAHVDLVLFDFAINLQGACVATGAELELLLRRAAQYAPRAAFLFVNTFALDRFEVSDNTFALDPSERDRADSDCVERVARHHRVPVVSWRAALEPLMAAEHWSTKLLEEAFFETRRGLVAPHHPNVEGHKHLASVVVGYLLAAEKRVEGSGSAAKLSGDWLYPETQLTCTDECVEYDALVARGCDKHSRAAAPCGQGWALDAKRGYLTASDPGATLVIPFSCRSPGCGVAIGVTRSYMPLGLADVFVRIHNATARTLFQPNVSAADPELHRNATNITVHRFLTVVPPCSDGMGRASAQCGLPRGHHSLVVVCQGRALPETRDWPMVNGAYAEAEFHVRSLRVFGSSPPDGRC